MATVAWAHVTDVESDADPGTTYAIERRADGALRCACMAYRFCRGKQGDPAKTCKHIAAFTNAAYTAGANSIVVRKSINDLAKARRAGQPVTETETFTLRRAITFEPLGSGR